MGVRGTTLALVGGLVAIGLFAASPFLCKRLVGTGEAFNYSLSIADSLEQMRAGVMPPLAGQTEYAFNGRIHPLRTAPYLYYLAAALDEATLHRLTAWQLQNLSLVLSLVGSGLACYLGLRRGVGCPRGAAFLLSAAYALAPPLLGAAHSFDLFMTVHVAVFVPLAVAACLRGVLKPSFSADAWLAAALGAAWLAHPPVALWLTFGVVFVRLAAFARRPSWSVLASGTCAAVLAAGLSLFVFASVVALDSSTAVISAKVEGDGIPGLIMDSLHSAFPACLLPVERGAGPLGSLQFGYVAWLLLALTAACLWRGSRRTDGEDGTGRFAALLMVVFAALLLVLTLPIPWLTLFLWRLVPGVALELTTIWPMQRLYLVAVAFTLFGAALTLPKAWAGLGRRRWIGAAAVLIAAAWTLYQAEAYVRRGHNDRRPMEATLSAYRPSNIDLTETSYAYFGVPPTYVVGVMDPQFEFRLLRNGIEEVGSNLATAVATAPAVAREVLSLDHPAFLTLAPGKRYLLTFGFLTPPVQGFLEITGPLLHRNYSLPAAGRAAAFGMNDGQRRSISLWTDGSRPERIRVRLEAPELNTRSGRLLNFADLTLQEVQPEKLPVRLEGLVPMKFEVDAPRSGLTVETPRRFIPGYEAIVNGHRVTPLMSPYRQVMVPVPPGHSVVELQCMGPAYVPFAFWVTAAFWGGFIVWRLSGSRFPRDPAAFIARPSAGLLRIASRHWVLSLMVAAVAVAALLGATRFERRQAYLRAVGPLRIDFLLPYGQPEVSQPLLTTGQAGAAVVVIIHIIDESHVWVGADVWGAFFKSEPVELDFSQAHNIVVSDSALFPVDHPAVKALTPGEVEQLRGELRVELDGATVIHEKHYAYETKVSETLVGTTPFTSMANPKFLGEILGTQRLRIPRTLTLPVGRHAHLELRFPTGREGSSEPLVAFSTGNGTCACYATYLSPGVLRITDWSPGQGILDSAEVKYDPRQSHDVDFTPGLDNDRTLGLDVTCRFDGSRLFGRDRVHTPGIPPVIVSAFNSAAAPGVQSRFTGSQMNLSLVQGVSKALGVETFGPVHMIVLFPGGKPGRHEPLLTTGHTGAADMVYVIYEDAGHVRIGYDHWGVSGVTSDPIAVDYRVPHEIWISMASLNPGAGQDQTTRTSVLLDGKPALSSALHPYPSLQAEVTVAKNPVGASTADPDFSGAVQFAERTGTTPAPSPRS